MNTIKMQKLGILLLVITVLTSCKQEPTFDYKYADKEQLLECSGSDNTLLNEVLHTFEEDLMYGYGRSEDGPNLQRAYGQFLYTGFSGTAQFEQFASAHALEVKKALLAEGVLIEGGVKSNLNYNHLTVRCIINKIEDKDLANTINALIDTNSMDPKLFNGRMRNFGRDALKNRYEALYVALDTYFQQITVARTEQTINE